MKKSFYVLLTIALIATIFSCKEDENNPIDTSKKPNIGLIIPKGAVIGDIIVILGTKFGATQGTSFVTFNTTKATEYISWTDSEIKVKVPTAVVSGKLKVTVDGVSSKQVDYKIFNFQYGTVSDINGNTYKTIKICNQTWMVENLNVSRYRNGDSIPEVRDSVVWEELITGAWCYYNNDPAIGKIYGKLYNWFAVNDPRGLAPEGWHIPSNDEWTVLVDCLGGRWIAGDKLISTGTIEHGNGLWRSPNWSGTNESGFSAFPSGYRSIRWFLGLYNECYWWSATEGIEVGAWGRCISVDRSIIGNGEIKSIDGLSIRCVKD